MISTNVSGAVKALGYMPLTSVRLGSRLYSVAALERGGVVELRVEAGRREVGRITRAGSGSASSLRARIMHKQLMRVFRQGAPALEPALYTRNGIQKS